MIGPDQLECGLGEDSLKDMTLRTFSESKGQLVNTFRTSASEKLYKK